MCRLRESPCTFRIHFFSLARRYRLVKESPIERSTAERVENSERKMEIRSKTQTTSATFDREGVTLMDFYDEMPRRKVERVKKADVFYSLREEGGGVLPLFTGGLFFSERESLFSKRLSFFPCVEENLPIKESGHCATSSVNDKKRARRSSSRATSVFARMRAWKTHSSNYFSDLYNISKSRRESLFAVTKKWRFVEWNYLIQRMWILLM